MMENLFFQFGQKVGSVFEKLALSIEQPIFGYLLQFLFLLSVGVLFLIYVILLLVFALIEYLHGLLKKACQQDKGKDQSLT